MAPEIEKRSLQEGLVATRQGIMGLLSGMRLQDQLDGLSEVARIVN